MQAIAIGLWVQVYRLLLGTHACMWIPWFYSFII